VAAGDVPSYANEDGERLLLFDPLAVPDELLALALERDPMIVLTAPWHERDTQTLVGRLGATVFAPPPDSPQDLVDKYGITAEQAGDGSPDLQWLRSGGVDVHWYSPGDRLPTGIEAFAGREHNDLVLWAESVGAVIAGDSLADFGTGLARRPPAAPSSRGAALDALHSALRTADLRVRPRRRVPFRDRTRERLRSSLGSQPP
jgi:hypothetical protein